jgi:plastocyanin
MSIQLKKIVTLLMVMAVGLSLVACGGGDDKKKTNKTSSKKSSSSKSKKKSKSSNAMGPANGTLDLKNTGSISGTVKFAGSAPAAKMLDNSKDKWCAEQGNIADETLVVGSNGGLRDVFVFVEGLDAHSDDFPLPTAAAKITQKNCQYVPHVIGVRVGQDVAVTNADDTSHNYHFLGRANDEINKTQPKPATDIEVFEAAEFSASMSCDIHPWMNAVVHIMDHPCFTVSAKDGSFKINGVPPGKYKVRFLHSGAKASKDGINVTVSAKGSASIGEISFSK